MNSINGVVPVLITPLLNNGEIDVVSLENIVQYYNQKNVDAVWCLGTGGEDMCLSFSQRLEVANIVSNTLNKNIKLFLGCSFFSPKESMNFIHETKNLDIFAYHAMPYHQKVSLTNIEMWYRDINDSIKKLENGSSLYAYTSGNWAQRIPANLIEKLKNENIITGVKYSSSNILDIYEVLKLTENNFSVITAVVKTFLACLKLGVNATTSIEASLFYEDIKCIHEKFVNNFLSEAHENQSFLNNTLLNYPSEASKDNFLRVSEIKYLLSLKGVCKEYVTPYYRLLTKEEKVKLENYYSNYEDRIFA
ncbi:MAG: dihydrodipicolinate synthase family protein [Pseudomonadota bacterium]|nr:dihydrodipicolinate synthase family protein [Pseudomonadota bacterium]